MEQVVEPMDVDVSMTEVYKFDDLIDDSIKLNDALERRAHDSNKSSEVPQKRYDNKSGTFSTGIDIFSKEEQQKMVDRAKRFGLAAQTKDSSVNEYDELLSSLGIDKDSEAIKNLRLNVMHMRGTESMSTQDIFKYFEQYAPASIEWINDVSCNVVWLDNVSAARALKGMSKKIVGLEELRDPKFTTDSSEKSSTVTDDGSNAGVIEEDGEIVEQDKNVVSVEDVTTPLPPGGWRKGISCQKSKGIFLRFATRADKKQRHAEKMSEYYKTHGNPNFGGAKGLLSQSRKRFYKQIKNEKRTEKDLNGSEKSKNNPWGSLSQNWGVNDAVEDDFTTYHATKDQVHQTPQTLGSRIKDRLGAKHQAVSPEKARREPSPSLQSSESESESSSEGEWCKRSKVLRMRMHADDEEAKIQKRRTKQPSKKSVDLRSKIMSKSKQQPVIRDSIQVVVMNPRVANNDVVHQESEEEEGEIVEEYYSDENEENKVRGKEKSNEKTKEKEEEEEVEEEEEEDENEEEDEESDSGSDISEKEVQGPKGSVIKVLPRKPRLASTVWTRLNNMKSVVGQNTLKERYATRRDLRDTINKGVSGDLRSRLGSYVRGRSPLRIEVKNDKCAEEDSATD